MHPGTAAAPAQCQYCGQQLTAYHVGANKLALLLQEVSILKSLNYDKNIVQFYGACMHPEQDLMLVTEVRRQCTLIDLDQSYNGTEWQMQSTVDVSDGGCTRLLMCSAPFTCFRHIG